MNKQIIEKVLEELREECKIKGALFYLEIESIIIKHTEVKK